MGSAGRVAFWRRDGRAATRGRNAALAPPGLNVLDWTGAQARLQEPIFAPLADGIALFPGDRWPDAQALTQAADGVRTASGYPVRFVSPPARPERERRHYELRIAESGEVETRPENWHDLFNALQWLAYPRAKAAINAQHVELLSSGGLAELKKRSPRRDALTLFDEGGVVVASSAPETFRRIEAFRWKELFWERRGELEATTRFLAFGHALFEKGLAPYIGMVAKTIFVPVAHRDIQASTAMLRARCDAWLAAHLATPGQLATPKAMAPMPVLGVPGWHPHTDREAFYDDATHFRGSRPNPLLAVD